jgi:hypothetical protein
MWLKWRPLFDTFCQAKQNKSKCHFVGEHNWWETAVRWSCQPLWSAFVDDVWYVWPGAFTTTKKIQLSRATSRVKWLNGEKNNVLRTISVLVLRLLQYPEDEKTFIRHIIRLNGANSLCTKCIKWKHDGQIASLCLYVLSAKLLVLITMKFGMHHHHHQWRYSPDRALTSLTCFMIVIVRCGLSAPRSTWFYTPWFSHQRQLVVTTRDSSGEAGKHGWETWPLNFAYEASFSCS